MAPQGQPEHEHDHQLGQPNSSHTDTGRATTSNIGPNPPWEPFSSAGDFAGRVAVVLAALLIALAVKAAVRVMPACACRHGFHARCIERWTAGGRRSSCPTCRAPSAVVTTAAAAAAAAQPDEGTNRREPHYSVSGDYARNVAVVILAALMIAVSLTMLEATVRYFVCAAPPL